MQLFSGPGIEITGIQNHLHQFFLSFFYSIVQRLNIEHSHKFVLITISQIALTMYCSCQTEIYIMFKELFLFENNVFWQDYICELYIVNLIDNTLSKTV